jgi:hypothetical protein
MTPDFSVARVKEIVAIIIFATGMGLLCRLVWTNPYYNWDSLPYSALVQVNSSDPVTLHRAAYGLIDAEAPEQISREFHSPERYPNYRGDMAGNPWHFAEQLPLYSVKTFYILVLKAVHSLGPSTLTAMRMVSLLSYAILGVVLFLWMRRWAGSLLAAVGTCFVLSTAEFLGTGAETTPDAFFAALSLLALYLIFAEKKIFPALCLLAVLPLIRSDGLVLLALVLAYLIWRSPGFRFRDAGGIMTAELLVYFVTGRLAGGYGYEKLLYHSFVRRQLAPAESVVHLSLGEYFHALYIFVLGTLATPRPIYFLLGLTSFKNSLGEASLRHLTWLALAFTVIHILAFPLPDSRFLVLPFALFILWAVHALTQSGGAIPRPWLGQ